MLCVRSRRACSQISRETGEAFRSLMGGLFNQDHNHIGRKKILRVFGTVPRRMDSCQVTSPRVLHRSSSWSGTGHRAKRTKVFVHEYVERERTFSAVYRKKLSGGRMTRSFSLGWPVKIGKPNNLLADDHELLFRSRQSHQDST